MGGKPVVREEGVRGVRRRIGLCNHHLDAGIDWSSRAEPYRVLIERMLGDTVLPGLSESICTQRLLTPADFQSRYLAFKGAAFGMEHKVPVLRAERIHMTGLKPGTLQTYQAFPGEAGKGSFKTPPSEATPFEFVVYGDTRTRHAVHRAVAVSSDCCASNSSLPDAMTDAAKSSTNVR